MKETSLGGEGGVVFGFGHGFFFEDAGVVDGHDAYEVVEGGVPGVEDHACAVGVGFLEVLSDVVLELVPFFLGVDLAEGDHAGVALVGEGVVGVVDVGDAAAHAGGEVAPRDAEDDEAAAGHVFGAVVSEALDDGEGARVADAESLAGLAPEEGFASRRAVEAAVADDDVVRGDEGRLGQLLLVGGHDDAASREALGATVVRVALDLDGHSGGQREPEALPGGAVQRHRDRIFRQAADAEALRDERRQHRPEGSVDVRQVEV
mmetsp:Transcript_14691/g.47869  ORF Transcript_14691/g.47869 Transcript_14691/m.47869 type:complete len:262 (-) Transcript_14691:493-1278(-)